MLHIDVQYLLGSPSAAYYLMVDCYQIALMLSQLLCQAKGISSMDSTPTAAHQQKSHQEEYDSTSNAESSMDDVWKAQTICRKYQGSMQIASCT